MKRKNTFQFSNQKWYPEFLKNSMYEFMTWFVNKVGAAKPFLPVMEEALKHQNSIVSIDMNLGAGFETLAPYIDKEINVKHLSFENFNIDQKGVYVLVNSFHQLRREQAYNLLKQVSESGNSCVILEGNNDSLWQVFGMTVIVPLTVIFTAAFVKPFRIERLLFTYVIPVLPFVTFWDGFMALFKLYAPSDLDQLTEEIKSENYYWRSGKMDNNRGGKIIYLIGYKSN